MSKFEEECLNKHNKCRAKHGCPPLTLNQELSNIAKKWAEHLTEIDKKKRSSSVYGENIYRNKSKKAITGKDPVEEWYSEIKNYRYPIYADSDNFTQVLWKNSKKLGVGYAKKGSLTYVVCFYDPPGNPPGNDSGTYVQNVPPPCTGDPALLPPQTKINKK